MDYDWQLQIQDCTGCGICFDVCDFDAIEMTRDMAYPEAVSGACTGCLVCEDECPFGAIVVIEAGAVGAGM